MMTKVITLRIEDLKDCDKIVINIIRGNEEYDVEENTKKENNTISNISFSDFAESEINSLYDKNRFNTANGYKCAINNYMKFFGKKNIWLEDINTENLKKFECWLQDRNLYANTISFYLKKLRALHNKITYKYNISNKDPFKYVYTGKANTAKRAINKEEIKKLTTFKTNSPGKKFAIDMFMLSFYLRGISFIDLAHLTKENIKNGILSYKRKKTGQILRIKWEKCMEDIVCKYSNTGYPYLLPIIKGEREDKEFNQYRGKLYGINKNLKEIGRTLHFQQPLTMYVARHSWASIARLLNIPLPIISYGMGHDSELTTNIYLKTLDYSKIDSANAKIINEITKDRHTKKSKDRE